MVTIENTISDVACAFCERQRGNKRRRRGINSSCFVFPRASEVFGSNTSPPRAVRVFYSCAPFLLQSWIHTTKTYRGRYRIDWTTAGDGSGLLHYSLPHHQVQSGECTQLQYLWNFVLCTSRRLDTQCMYSPCLLVSPSCSHCRKTEN